MQQDARCDLATLVVIDMVQHSRQQRMGRTDIGIAPVPLDQGHLAHGRSRAGALRQKNTVARTPP